jgi:ADP-ribose pyrophosphatase
MDRETLATQRVYDGKVVKLDVDRVRLPDGGEARWEVVRHPGAVVIVPVLPDGRLLFIRQFRYPVRQTLWELPAGTLRPGEEPEACARRELEEETGYRAENWAFLGDFFTTPGFTDEHMYAFLAEGLRPTVQELEADEFIEVVPLPWTEVEHRVAANEIHDGKTLAALYLYILHRSAPS